MKNINAFDLIVVEIVRISMRIIAFSTKYEGVIPQIGSREVRTIKTSQGETRVIVYMPKKEKASGPYPVFINLHGGGFILGKPEDDDIFMNLLVDKAGCAIFNVDYKLAPEYKFPVALEEVYAVIQWIVENKNELNIDPNRIAIGGHSAGGNLSASICMLAKKRKDFNLVLQILDYPPLDIYKHPSLKKNVSSKLVIPSFVAAVFNKCYLEKLEDAKNPLVSPVYAKKEDLKGLPPALVFTAEVDNLWEEGEQYANMLKQAGVPVKYKKFPGCMHMFSHTGPPSAKKELWDTIAEALKNAFK